MKANSEEAARSVIAFRLPYLAKSGNIDNNFNPSSAISEGVLAAPIVDSSIANFLDSISSSLLLGIRYESITLSNANESPSANFIALCNDSSLELMIIFDIS